MRKSLGLLAAVSCLWLASGTYAAEIAKHRWADFSLGSWALLRTVPVGGGPEVLTRWTLVSLNKDAAAVEAAVDDGKHVTTRKVTFPIPDHPSHPDRVDEDVLRVKKKELKCRVLIYEEQRVRVWESDEVPGFTVKLESSKSVTTLVSYKVK